MQVKIYYYHTDSGGVVYYARYLEFLEVARTEYFAQKGFSIRELADKGVMFVVARQEIDYKYPAVYGDTLTIDTRIAEASIVRINFENEIKNQNDRLIVKAKTVLVCVNSELRPQEIPDEIHSQLRDTL